MSATMRVTQWEVTLKIHCANAKRIDMPGVLRTLCLPLPTSHHHGLSQLPHSTFPATAAAVITAYVQMMASASAAIGSAAADAAAVLTPLLLCSHLQCCAHTFAAVLTHLLPCSHICCCAHTFVAVITPLLLRSNPAAVLTHLLFSHSCSRPRRIPRASRSWTSARRPSS